MAKFFATILSFLLMGSFSAHAQTSNTQVMPNYNFETIRPPLQEMGFALEERSLPSGVKYLIARSDDGAVLLVEPRACQAKNGCAGLYILALTNVSSTLENANSFNDRVPYSKAVIVGEGKSALSTYLIADYGTFAGSFAVNLIVFKQSIGEWIKFGKPSLSNSISYTPDDQSAAKPALVKAALASVDESLPFYVSAAKNDPSLVNGPDPMDALATGRVHDAAKDVFPSLFDE